jgi:hypothetical protein
VVLLRHRPYVPRGPIVDAGPDNYDVLRFDGTCATLAEDEFRVHGPRQPRYAPLVWRHLDAHVREAFSEHKRVQHAQRDQSRQCRGMYIGGGNADCQLASQKLARAIVLALAHGVDLPRPAKLPDWSPEPD